MENINVNTSAYDLKVMFHDFSNAITRIICDLELVCDDLPVEYKEKAVHCKSRILNAHKIVKDFVKDSIDKDIEKIEPLIREVLEEFTYSDIQLTVNLDDIKIKTKPRIIKTIVRNFLSNSIRELDKLDGEKILKIKTGINNNLSYIQVEDNGKGVSKEQLTEICKRGVSFSNSTGEGLYYCLEKAREMGGDVHIISESFNSTIFRLEIPVKKEKYE